MSSIDDLAEKYNFTLGRIFPGGYEPAHENKETLKPWRAKDLVAVTNEFDINHPFYQKHVVFTGALCSMERREAMQRVIDLGGICQDGVNKDTDYLILGEQDFRKLNSGEKSNKMVKVEKLISQGFTIEIIKENDFLKTINI